MDFLAEHEHDLEFYQRLFTNMIQPDLDILGRLNLKHHLLEIPIFVFLLENESRRPAFAQFRVV